MHRLSDQADFAQPFDPGVWRYLRTEKIEASTIASDQEKKSCRPSSLSDDVPKVLRSSSADDPKMQRLLAQFVSRLPKRVDSLISMLMQENLTELQRAIHQI